MVYHYYTLCVEIFPRTLIVYFGESSLHGFALSTKYGVWDLSVVVVHHALLQGLIRHVWGASLADVGLGCHKAKAPKKSQTPYLVLCVGIFPHTLIVRFGESSLHSFALSTKYGVWDFWSDLTL